MRVSKPDVLTRLRLRAEPWLVPFRGLCDARRLRRLVPELATYECHAASVRSRLAPIHDRYIVTVSKAEMAVSLELAVFLYVWAELRRPESILDLGSGFSSFVLRLYAASVGGGVRVRSVDDSTEWLEKTSAFLRSQGMDDGNLMTYDVFVRSDTTKYQLILHDVGCMGVRGDVLPAVLGRIAPAGSVVLDDTHMYGYRLKAVQAICEAGLVGYSLRAYTQDRFGRFGTLVMLPASGG